MGATLNINGQKLTVKGELPNGVFYLEGPRGGSVHFAKPLVDDLFTVSPSRVGSSALRDVRGLLITITREELTK
jgi:hypothetical protein